ncbi:MAG: peptidase C1 [Proteobacteria bacterium]|nr:peptidase C1 [Pseudomonadota bacterium]
MKQVIAIITVLFIVSCQSRPENSVAAKNTEMQGKDPETPENGQKRVVEIQAPALRGEGGVSTARYETKTLHPVLEEMRTRDREWQSEQDDTTSEIRGEQKDKKEKERKERLVLKSSLPDDQRPTSPKQFETIWHSPPVPQYNTGTCWSFCATSFLESETHRITSAEIKLSEMSTVYWEYVEKAGGYLDTRGNSLFNQGSESNAVTRAFKKHGAWPANTYAGVAWEDGRHDHERMAREMKSMLGSFKSNHLWDKEAGLSMIRVILDRDMGRPPEKFEHNGKVMTPSSFMTDVCKINPDDYVEFISTLEFPFFTQCEFKVPDNWWHDESYYNVPLDDFYENFKKAIKSGYSAVIAVDTSEPGRDAKNDVMFVPAYDIPGDRINQLAREYRFAHKVTSDDHGIHIVGWKEHAGHDWFLAKDSGRSAYRGKHEGYFFVRDDYVRLKVLSFMVHRNAVEELLSKFPPSS